MRIYCLLLIFICLISGSGFLIAQNNQEVDILLEKAEKQINDTQEKSALKTYLEILNIDSLQYEALWRVSLLNSTIGYRLESETEQKDYFTKAIEYAQKSIDHYPKKGHPYYVMAVAEGRMTDVVGTRSQIRLAHSIEENITQALEFMPNHAPSWHLYGVWQSEVGNTGRAQRFVARFISKGLPDASNEKAELFLQRAMNMDPDDILIRLDLAYHYNRAGEKEEAISTLDTLFSLNLKPRTKDDPKYLQEAEELYQDLK